MTRRPICCQVVRPHPYHGRDGYHGLCRVASHVPFFRTHYDVWMKLKQDLGILRYFEASITVDLSNFPRKQAASTKPNCLGYSLWVWLVLPLYPEEGQLWLENLYIIRPWTARRLLNSNLAFQRSPITRLYSRYSSRIILLLKMDACQIYQTQQYFVCWSRYRFWIRIASFKLSGS